MTRSTRSGLPFGGSPTFALAMPIVVDAESIAIVYADDFAEPRQESRNDEDVNAKFAEALRQHTVALLMRLTTELKAMAELRAYAASLLSEIEQMYQIGRRGGQTGRGASEAPSRQPRLRAEHLQQSGAVRIPKRGRTARRPGRGDGGGARR